jgi:hypothetical protein
MDGRRGVDAPEPHPPNHEQDVARRRGHDADRVEVVLAEGAGPAADVGLLAGWRGGCWRR